MQLKVIVTDIEGTTSALSFVKDVLFPYSRQSMAEFVRQHKEESVVRVQLDSVKQVVGREMSDDQVIEQLLRWIHEDQKITPQKVLQGMIWEAGYRKGDFKGHIYEDAFRNLCRWQEKGIKLYVYSSGSIQAQKLLFSHTEYGDLTPLFSGFFDTYIGNKKAPVSYQKIAETIDEETKNILFLSDSKEELDAARSAGMQTYWLVREGNLDPAAEHQQVADFDSISI